MVVENVFLFRTNDNSSFVNICSSDEINDINSLVHTKISKCFDILLTP